MHSTDKQVREQQHTLIYIRGWEKKRIGQVGTQPYQNLPNSYELNV